LAGRALAVSDPVKAVIGCCEIGSGYAKNDAIPLSAALACGGGYD
jgi:hypothetical protein